MTPAEAEPAFDSAPSVPLSEERIKEIVEAATPDGDGEVEWREDEAHTIHRERFGW